MFVMSWPLAVMRLAAVQGVLFFGGITAWSSPCRCQDFDPITRGPLKAIPEGFTSWDRTIIREGNLTCKQVVEYMEVQQKLSLYVCRGGNAIAMSVLIVVNRCLRSVNVMPYLSW